MVKDGDFFQFAKCQRVTIPSPGCPPCPPHLHRAPPCCRAGRRRNPRRGCDRGHRLKRWPRTDGDPLGKDGDFLKSWIKSPRYDIFWYVHFVAGVKKKHGNAEESKMYTPTYVYINHLRAVWIYIWRMSNEARVAGGQVCSKKSPPIPKSDVQTEMRSDAIPAQPGNLRFGTSC